MTAPRPAPAGLAARLALALGLAAAGCAQSDRPYRFSSPLIGGAELPSGPALDEGDEAHAPSAAPRRDGNRGSHGRQERVAMAPIRTERDPSAVARHPSAPSRGTSTAAGSSAGSATGAEVTRGKTSAPPASAAPGLAAEATPDDPRSWVGVRDDSDPVRAVVALCARKNPRCPSRQEDLALLAQREAWLPASTPFTVGDLLLFDRVGLDNGEQIVALVTARQQRGVFELAYLAAGVWRRGLIDPMRPRLHRDGEGRVVNTFLRHRRAALPEGTRFLTGELLVGVLPLGPGAEPARPALAAAAR